MKESGDRGKMCFCETDYCNGSKSAYHLIAGSSLILTISIVSSFSLISYFMFFVGSNNNYNNRKDYLA